MTSSLKVGEYYRIHACSDIFAEIVQASDNGRDFISASRYGLVAGVVSDSMGMGRSSLPYDEVKQHRLRSLSDLPWVTTNIYGSLEDLIDFTQVHGEVGRASYNQGEYNTLMRWLILNVEDIPYSDTTAISVSVALSLFRPFASKITEGNISLTRTAKDDMADRQTSMKFGRGLRYMFPHLTNEKIEKLVTLYRTQFSPRTFFLKTGKSRADFRHAYIHERADYFNPYTTSTRKSLASSCLHGELTQDDVSPAEVYASGDFTIAWLEDQKGNIAGRVVYRDAFGPSTERQPQSAPIYGVCEVSLNQLQDHLDVVEAVFNVEGWQGAKLLKIYDDSYGQLVGPYIDGDLSASDYGGGMLLLQDSYEGEHRFENTNGYVSDSCQFSCCACDDGLDEDNVYSNDDGDQYCECCFNEYYVHTQDGPVNRDDAVEVMYLTSFNYGSGTVRPRSEYTHIDNAVFCDCVEEYWYPDACTMSDDEEEYVPTHLISDYPDVIAPEQNEDAA